MAVLKLNFTTKRCFQSGFTLVEIIVALAVFSVALTALVVAFNPSVTGASNPVLQVRAAELGQAYLEEILGKRFDENTPVGAQTRCGDGIAPACSGTLGADGESRVNFDDVDDYNGLSEAPTDPLGNLKDRYSGFTVSVTVTYDGASIGLNNDEAKRVDISVQRAGSPAYNFSVYKTNF
ncbi:MAG: type II secretion system protein [Gammaproteobacteria bacterium]|nr:type II secretion system protein [Gammaproteobacteria bacterium]